MKTAIWKYKLNSEKSQQIEMPVGAGILSVQVINNVALLYALVNLEERETEMKTIEIIYTGNELNDGLQYRFIDTFTITKVDSFNDSRLNTLVGHVFEILAVDDTNEISDDVKDDDISGNDGIALYADDKDEAYDAFKGTGPYYEGIFTILRSGLDPNAADKVLRAIFDAGYDA